MLESDQVAGACSIEGYQGGSRRKGHNGEDTGQGPGVKATFHPGPAEDGSNRVRTCRNSLRVNTLGQGQ